MTEVDQSTKDNKYTTNCLFKENKYITDQPFKETEQAANMRSSFGLRQQPRINYKKYGYESTEDIMLIQLYYF